MSEYKRDHPRIKESLPAEIIAPGNKSLFVTTCDLSRNGVQFICDGVTVREIFGDATLAPPATAPTVTLKLTLGHSAREAEKIEATCRAIFSRRVSEQEYRVGLQIDALSRPSRRALDNFIDK